MFMLKESTRDMNRRDAETLAQNLKDETHFDHPVKKKKDFFAYVLVFVVIAFILSLIF